MPLGALLATVVAAFVSSEGLRLFFAVMGLVLAARMLFLSNRMHLGTDLPGQPWRFLTGSAIGLFSGLMGVGGGVFNNTFMTLYGRPIHQAVATSSGVGVLISIPGALGFIYAGWPKLDVLPPLSLGYVSLIGFILFIPTSIWTAPIGARLAHRLSKRKLEVVFGLFLLLVAARFIWSLVV